MNVRCRFVCSVITVGLLAACAKAPPAESPTAVVERFYASYLRDRQGGRPFNPSGRLSERLTYKEDR